LRPREAGAAKTKASIIHPVLEAAGRFLPIAQTDAIEYVPIADALDGRIERLEVLYPGGPGDYVSSQQLFCVEDKQTGFRSSGLNSQPDPAGWIICENTHEL
jgi:hypothetical protein